MFKIINISKKYKNQTIFNDVSIDFSNPGIYLFQGVNGSGKSTLIKILAGMIYKTSGNIEKDISISYLPDKFSMPKLMLSKDYIKLFLSMTKREKMASELLDKFQIPNRRIGFLSKGNQQKLALLQILYTDADCYIFDEPLDGLDEYAKGILKDIITELINRGKIIIISLHTSNLFSKLKPTIIEFKDGKISLKKKRGKKDEEEI